MKRNVRHIFFVNSGCGMAWCHSRNVRNPMMTGMAFEVKPIEIQMDHIIIIVWEITRSAIAAQCITISGPFSCCSLDHLSIVPSMMVPNPCAMLCAISCRASGAKIALYVVLNMHFICIWDLFPFTWTSTCNIEHNWDIDSS